VTVYGYTIDQFVEIVRLLFDNRIANFKRKVKELNRDEDWD